MKPLAAFLFATLIISNGLAVSPTSPTVIIDTTFQEADADGRPLTATAPVDIGELPLTTPTRVNEQPSAVTSPSLIRVGKEDFDLLKPPYLILQAGEKPDEPGAIADVSVFWDLQKLALSEGLYEITFDVAACQNDKLGGVFRLVFQSQTPDFGKGMHPFTFPGGIWFLGNGQILIGGSQAGADSRYAYNADEVQHCVMRLDMDKKTWSMEINGENLFESLPLPEFFQTEVSGSLRFRGISFGSARGTGCQANARFILANVKVTKLAN